MTEPRGRFIRLSRDDFARIKQQVPIVDALRRMGVDPPSGWDGHGEFRVPAAALGLPHGDDSSGVLIKPGEERWWAFHSKQGGDVFALVQAVTGETSLGRVAAILESGEAIPVSSSRGADRSPVVASARAVNEQPQLDRTSRERVQQVNAAAWDYLTFDGLAQRARDYLQQRGIDVTALEAEVGRPLAGHTPYSRTGLIEHLTKRGFTADEIVDAGWGARRSPEQPLRDRLHGRVLIPFRDEQDRVVGVTGRAVRWSKGDPTPKYLNHPPTNVFDKSAVLYRPSVVPLAPNATVVHVEGTLDALAIAAAAARAGHSSLFAPTSQSGLSLTDQVAPRFFAISPRPPILCGDGAGDEAGQAAMEKWVARAMTTWNREVLTLTLPDGHDPASWLAEKGSAGLISFARGGCLTDTDHVRAVPAGALLARREYDRAVAQMAGAEPDLAPALAVGVVIDRLAERAEAITNPVERDRFVAWAGAALADVAPGGNAEQRTTQLATAITQRAATPSAELSTRPRSLGLGVA